MERKDQLREQEIVSSVRDVSIFTYTKLEILSKSILQVLSTVQVAAQHVHFLEYMQSSEDRRIE